MTHEPALTFFAINSLPEVRPGDDLATLLATALHRGEPPLQDGDVLVVVQKIVSKAENRYAPLTEIEPSAEARKLATRCRKDPRLVELVLRESTEVVRVAPDVLIVRHRLGFIVANAAIDQSNLSGREERALLLPLDPDASARRLREAIAARLGVDVAVLISDSFGRPWRMGVTGVCIGCAGLQALFDLRGTLDRSGCPLQVTQLAIGDQLCATATLVAGEAAEGRPMVVIRGLPVLYRTATRPAIDLLRPADQDLFK